MQISQDHTQKIRQCFEAKTGPRIRRATTTAPSHMTIHQYEGRIRWWCTKPSIQTDALISRNEFVKISPCSKDYREHYLCCCCAWTCSSQLCEQFFQRVKTYSRLHMIWGLGTLMIREDPPTQTWIIEALCCVGAQKNSTVARTLSKMQMSADFPCCSVSHIHDMLSHAKCLLITCCYEM